MRLNRRALLLFGGIAALGALAWLAVNRAAGDDASTGPDALDELLFPLRELGAYVSGQRMSAAGLSALEAREAFRPSVYADQAGLPTIGYGHRVLPTENFSIPIMQEQATLLLASDVGAAERAVNAAVTVPLTQNQFDALVSFVFNVGVSAFRNSTLLAQLNAGDYASAGDQFAQWNKITVAGQKVASAGLDARRASEAAQFFA